MKKFILFSYIMLAWTLLYAQPDYSRNTLTTVALNFNENHNGEIFSRFPMMSVPDKFFNNPLTNPVIDMGAVKRPVMAELPELLQYMNDDFIIGKLQEQKVAQQVLSQWFNRQKDGSFNVEVLKERGLYNANDNDFLTASASKRGTSTLMDMGLSLVNQSYVLVFDYYSIMNMNEYYIKNETPEKDRISNGYIAKVKTYLYRLDFGENVATDFFNKYWINPDDKDKAGKIEAFNKASFRWIPVGRQIAEYQSTQYNQDKITVTKQKTKEELIDDLNKNLMEKILPQMEARNEDMRVKAMVHSVHPIAAKIGKKEGLGFDQRYFVYENQMKKDGSVNKKRITVIKSYKVIDNRKVTKGETETSWFYQIAGGKVDNLGMYLEQKNDVGMNLFLGNSFQGLPGPTARLEFYISKFMGDLVGSGKSGKALTSLKLYVEGAISKDKYSYDFEDTEYKFTRVSFGLNKDYYPIHFIHWGPYVGYGLEFTDWSDTNQTIESDFVEAGARLGINITYNIQLVGSANYYFLISSKVKDADNVIIDDDFNYKDVFTDRMGLGTSLGLRIMF